MASAIVIIPCYNEENRFDIASFREFDCASHHIQFVLADDGSTDKTLQLLESLSAANPAKFKVLHIPRNHGKAEAVRRGFLSAFDADPDYVGFWDADLATPLSAIGQFLDVAESDPRLEIIIGSRVKLLGRSIARRPSRHYLGRLFATAVSIVLDLPVYDSQCGAKIFKVSPAIKALFGQPFHSRWIFDVEIIARLIQEKRGIATQRPEDVIYEFPLTEWRDIPGSKLKYFDFIIAAWELLRIRRYYF